MGRVTSCGDFKIMELGLAFDRLGVFVEKNLGCERTRRKVCGCTTLGPRPARHSSSAPIYFRSHVLRIVSNTWTYSFLVVRTDLPSLVGLLSGYQRTKVLLILHMNVGARF